MLRNSDRITTFQMFILIVSTINAIEVLILPRDLVLDVGTDGWLVIIGAHLISAAAVFFMIKLSLLYPDETFADYTPKILGRYIGIPVVLTAVVFWTLLCARIVRQLGDFIQLILPQTPIETIIVTMLLVVVYVARHGIEPIARTLEVLFPIFVGLVGILSLITLLEIDLTNLLPILQSEPKQLIMSSLTSSLGLEGQELMLMIMPFMAIPGKVYKAVYGALGFNLILRLTLFITTIGLFGVEFTKTLVWPVEELSRSLSFAGSGLGRLDSLFTALWVTAAFTSILVFMYLASLAFSRVMKFREPSMTVFPLLPIIFILSLVPESIVATEEYSGLIANTWGLFIFTMPPLLLVISYIRGTHKNRNQERSRER